MEVSNELQRYESSYRILAKEFNSAREELNELKREFNNVVEENKKLRRDLKDTISEKLGPVDKDDSWTGNQVDKNVANNLENQIGLLKKERDNAMQMWQNALQVISQLEQDLKTLQFKTAPETLSFELEMKKRQEEFARKEVALARELNVLRVESNTKDEDIMNARLKQNELRLQIENLQAQLNQKDQDRRNMIRKEFGYDDALISLQNDISELETRVLTLGKENQHLRDSLHDSQSKIIQSNKHNIEIERQNAEFKSQYDESIRSVERLKEDLKRAELEILRQREDHEKLHNVIGELMDEAANKTKQEIESLRKIYNMNLEKLIEECNFLETDRNNLAAQLERSVRAKKTVEQEIERITNSHLRVSSKENSSYEDLHKRLCTVEREKDQASTRLESKEMELKKLQNMLDHEKNKNYQIIQDLSEKSHKSTRDLEKLADDHGKLMNEIDELKNKLNSVEAERDNLQKKLTKQIQIHESEIQIKSSDYFNKTKSLEENHNKAMFELRQLLNMQQRMSNKWKEECHLITTQGEAKFTEMKKNFDNLRLHNEKLNNDVQELRRKELENERINDSYLNKIKTLETRVKDAEYQANEATKRIAKQLAREKMIAYEKHLLESDLERTKFVDTFSKGKIFLKNMNINEAPVKPTQSDNDDSKN